MCLKVSSFGVLWMACVAAKQRSGTALAAASNVIGLLLAICSQRRASHVSVER